MMFYEINFGHLTSNKAIYDLTTQLTTRKSTRLKVDCDFGHGVTDLTETLLSQIKEVIKKIPSLTELQLMTPPVGFRVESILPPSHIDALKLLILNISMDSVPEETMNFVTTRDLYVDLTVSLSAFSDTNNARLKSYIVDPNIFQLSITDLDDERYVATIVDNLGQSSITHLKLSGNRLSQTVQTIVTRAARSSVTHLKLNEVRVMKENIIRFINLAKVSANLERVDLKFNESYKPGTLGVEYSIIKNGCNTVGIHIHANTKEKFDALQTYFVDEIKFRGDIIHCKTIIDSSTDEPFAQYNKARSIFSGNLDKSCEKLSFISNKDILETIPARSTQHWNSICASSQGPNDKDSDLGHDNKKPKIG